MSWRTNASSRVSAFAAGGSGIRTGSGTSRGARLGSPTISGSLNFSMPSLSPSNGQASAARYWYSGKRRDRPEKLVAEPCTVRRWWIVIEPASGGNMQRWRFLVIRDPTIKQTVGGFYKRAWDEQVAPRYRSGEPAPGMSRERLLRLLDAAEYLAAHIHEAPVWIVPCLEGATPTRTSGSSIYPAVQNMLLAARALGLGATLTTLWICSSRRKQRTL